MTTITEVCHPREVAARTFRARIRSRLAALAWVPLVVITITVVGLFAYARWERASKENLRYDELPLLTRFTSLCGNAATEAQAEAYKPSLFYLRTGAVRSFRVLNGAYAIHTTTGFWANLSLNLLGYSAFGVRAGPFFWSLVALLATGWAAWLLTRHPLGVCAAVLVVAMSPFSIAYAAQVRGYSEAMALTPLLLISLEYLRRKPDSWKRAAWAMLCAFQLSLTVYTMWVFWVLPGLVLAVWLVPRHCETESGKRAARTVTIVLLLGMLCFMTVYTAERYKALFSAATYGERFTSFSGAADWLERVGRDFFAFPILSVVLALAGFVAVWRSSYRWWCWIMAVGVLAPFALAIANGSPGDNRNLSYLVPIVAMLAGVGAVLLVKSLDRHLSHFVQAMATATVVLFAAMGTYCGVNRQVAMILWPDWGSIVQRYESMPEPIGQRWICPCLANHWQIDWYAQKKRPASLLDVPKGGTIEVVMGAQLERQAPVVFRDNPVHAGIHPELLPPYLLAVPTAEFRAGIFVRRWRAQRVSPAEIEPDVLPAPAFVAVRHRHKPTISQWHAFLTDGGAYDHGVIEFNLDAVPGGFVQTFMMPESNVQQTIGAMTRYLGVHPDDVRVFSLEPLHTNTASAAQRVECAHRAAAVRGDSSVTSPGPRTTSHDSVWSDLLHSASASALDSNRYRPSRSM